MENKLSEKISTQLSAALLATPEELASSNELSSGYNALTDSWEVIVKYVGNIDYIKDLYDRINIIKLLGNYAVFIIPSDLVDVAASLPEIIYMEKPKQFNYEVYQGRRTSCITSIPQSFGTLTGEGVLLCVIDSGIDYTHPDFIENRKSRIAFLWDQTISTGPAPFLDSFGTVYDNETLTRAINAASIDERISICPSTDISGHGTHVAGIAAGNGNASNGVYKGVASKSTLIIVKLATSSQTSFPTTTQVMLAVDFCIRKANEMGMPAAINLSFGNSLGSHSGTSLLETYLDFIASNYRCSIIAGCGNEGTGYGHAGGNSYPGFTEFSVGDYEPVVSMSLWKQYWDKIRITLTAPDGSRFSIPESVSSSGSGFFYRYNIDSTNIYITGGGPAPYSPFQEIYIELSANNSYVSSGIWTLELTPLSIKDGNWDVWLASAGLRGNQTSFIQSDPGITLTIPSTSQKVISVGAYDSLTERIASFSGRGYTWTYNFIKPDLVAPGVDITSCAPGGGYTSKSGTSMAAPFVTGSAALLMEWGIVQKNDIYMYADKLKAYLINGAKPIISSISYPNNSTGWGALCLRNSLIQI